MTEHYDLTPEQKVTRCKIQLQKSHPFFAYLIMHLRIRDEMPFYAPFKTAAVDNRGNLYYDKEFIEKLTETQTKAVLAHEVLHCCFEHNQLSRVRTRDREVWNIACDIWVNNTLQQNGFDIDIDGLYLPKNNEYEFDFGLVVKDISNKSVERIYDEIYNDLKNKVSKSPKSGGVQVTYKDKNGKEVTKTYGFDGHIYNDKGEKDKTASQEEKIDWKKKLVEAYTHAKNIGKEPLGVERSIGEILNPKINWKSLLYKYITRSITAGYTFNRPSNKSQSCGIYLPRLKRQMLDVVVAIDTSGSIGQEELQEFLTEMVVIAKSFKNVRMKCIVADCAVHEVLEFRNGDIPRILDLKVKGGGGTSHKSVFEYIEENMPTSKLFVALTDGFSDINQCDERANTIWVLSSNGCMPEDIHWGEVIKIDK